MKIAQFRHLDGSPNNQIVNSRVYPAGEYGADTASRTPDLRITNALLYQLSYVGQLYPPQCIQGPIKFKYRYRQPQFRHKGRIEFQRLLEYSRAYSHEK